MNIYQPYVYCIIFTNPNTQEKFYYIGSRYKQKCKPSDLFVTYFTSSKHIKDLLNEFDLKCFTTKIIKTFKTRAETLQYEMKLLKRLNAKSRKDFINRSNGSWNINSGNNGPLCEKSRENFNRNRNMSNLEKYGVDHIMKLDINKEKRKQTLLKRYGMSNWSPMFDKEFKLKQQNIIFEKYGVKTPMESEEVKQTFRKNFKDKHGVESPFHLESVKIKKKETLLKRYGVEHNMKNPETAQKVGDAHRKRVKINGIEFNAIYEAAKYFNVNTITITRWIKNSNKNAEFI